MGLKRLASLSFKEEPFACSLSTSEDHIFVTSKFHFCGKFSMIFDVKRHITSNKIFLSAFNKFQVKIQMTNNIFMMGFD